MNGFLIIIGLFLLLLPNILSSILNKPTLSQRIVILETKVSILIDEMRKLEKKDK